MIRSDNNRAFSAEQFGTRLRVVLGLLLVIAVALVARAVERAFGPRARTALLEDNSQRREANRSTNRGIFVLGSGAVVTTAARAHANYGD